jgi:hypothetical protein
MEEAAGLFAIIIALGAIALGVAFIITVAQAIYDKIKKIPDSYEKEYGHQPRPTTDYTPPKP